MDGTKMSYDEYVEKIKREDGEGIARHFDAIMKQNIFETEMKIKREMFGSAPV